MEKAPRVRREREEKAQEEMTQERAVKQTMHKGRSF